MFSTRAAPDDAGLPLRDGGEGLAELAVERLR